MHCDTTGASSTANFLFFVLARQVDIEQQDGRMWRDPIVWPATLIVETGGELHAGTISVGLGGHRRQSLRSARRDRSGAAQAGVCGAAGVHAATDGRGACRLLRGQEMARAA
jgi:hypothetical protein